MSTRHVPPARADHHRARRHSELAPVEVRRLDPEATVGIDDSTKREGMI
jgi:hypothetical protein